MEFPPIADLKTAAALPEIPWRVIPAEEIEAALEVLAAGQPLILPPLEEEP